MTQKTLDRQSLKLAACVIENLPEMSPDVRQGWIQNPRGLRTSLEIALCPPGKEKIVKMPIQFVVWRKIRIGTDLKTVEDFRRALRVRDVRDLTKETTELLRWVASSVSETEKEVALVLTTPAGLGFAKGAKLRQIYRKALQLGLELCPAEVGPQLRLQYFDQPKGQWLVIAMEPVNDYKIFNVDHGIDGILSLGSDKGDPDTFWGEDHPFVFLYRKPQT